MGRVSVQDYTTHVAFLQQVTGELGHFHLTISGPRVGFIDSDRDPTLPTSSCRLTAPSGATTILAREDLEDTEVREAVRAWIKENVPLTGTRLRRGHHRKDGKWKMEWETANRNWT